MKIKKVDPVFVECIPELIERGKLYICEKYGTAIHSCCCGCGEEVVTPLSIVDWRIVKGRGGISLFPSVGNWDYQCQSHYIIRENRIIWANQMTAIQIEEIKLRDFNDKQNYIARSNSVKEDNTKQVYQETIVTKLITKVVKRAWGTFKKLFK